MTERILHGEDAPAGRAPTGVSRRRVLSGAVSASALTLASAPSAWGAIRPGAGPLRAVFDRGSPQGLAFAGRARTRGIPAFGFTGDMSRLWFDQILPALRKDRGPLMGFTGAGALFCFEQLAWDVGMRVRLRVDHARASDGFKHLSSVALPPSVLSHLQTAQAAFGESAAEVALNCRAAWGDCTHAAAPEAGVLVTWVIAPLALV